MPHIFIFTWLDNDIVTMQEEEEARRAILNIQEEIRRDLAKEKELQELRTTVRCHDGDSEEEEEQVK